MASYPKRSKKSSDEKIMNACQQDEYCNFTKTFIDGNIGFGVFTRKSFEPNEILIEYKGEIISRKEALVRHAKYSQEGMGCFIYDVDIKSKKMSIDATHSIGLGKYVNDAQEKFANCRPKTFVLDNVLHLLFIAKVFLPVGIELRYDYRDSKNQEWRQLKNYGKPFTLDEIRESLYVGKTLQKKVVVTASEILNTFADTRLRKTISVRENNLVNIPSNLSTCIEVVSHIPSKKIIPLLIASKCEDNEEKMKSYNNLDEADNLKQSLFESIASLPSNSGGTSCKGKRTFSHSKKKCPVCGFSFLKLPFHLREVHFWSKESSLAAISQFRLRKKMVSKEQTKHKRSHYTKICPIDGCYSTTKNIGEHLKGKKHNLKPGVGYYALLKKARPLKTAVSPKNVWSSKKGNQ